MINKKVVHQIILRKIILNLFQPTIKYLSKLSLPIKHNFENKHENFKELEFAPWGSVILTRTKYVASNYLIPGGFWTHCAMVVGNGGYCIEANAECGVEFKTMSEFLVNKDFIKIVAIDKSGELFEEIALDAEGYVGRRYDWQFENNLNTFYCAEIVALLLNSRIPNSVKPKIVMGIETFLPSQFEEYPFETLYDSRL